MNCPHPLSQIIVKDEIVLRELNYLNPCPWCKVTELEDRVTRYRATLEQITRLSPRMIAPFMYAQHLAKKELEEL